jgi:transcriptional regulator with XRE-family HTH domain
LAISAHLEASSKGAGKARSARWKLRLETRGALASGDATNVMVHDVSATGLLLESPVALAIGETIEIDLPHAGATRAKVIWTGGKFHGCQFDEPISRASLSAAQLRSALGEEAPSPVSRQTGQEESFSLRLQRLRKEQGLTLEQIATRIGVSRPTVWAWEQARARPVESRIEALAQALGVPVAELEPRRDQAGQRELLDRSREQIAKAFGTSPESVRIMIEL